MRYLPHTPEDISKMLAAIGVESLDDLFPTVPGDCRHSGELNLPEALSEWDLNSHVDTLADNITQLLENEGLRRHMGQQGRARVEAQFDVRKQCAKLEQIYAKLA